MGRSIQPQSKVALYDHVSMKRILNKLGFWGMLFLVSYFFLYIFPFPLEWLPFQIGERISSYIDGLWQKSVLSLVRDVWGYYGAIDTRVNGSGDMTYHFLKLLFQVAVSGILATVWFLLDKQRNIFKKIKPYAFVYARYYLAFTLLTYGFAKVFPNQFWEPGLT